MPDSQRSIELKLYLINNAKDSVFFFWRENSDNLIIVTFAGKNRK